jgi:Guanosine polyphosphate pyrophosphohydrolases/synthetases
MWLVNLLEQAIKTAVRAHEGQSDRAGMPYILHPLRVMHRMDTLEEKITAVLHDTVEDTPLTIEDLHRMGFPEPIAVAVETLTRRENEEYEEYIDRVLSNPLAVKVKIADLKDNMDLTRLREVKEHDIIRINKYIKALNKIQSRRIL